MEGLKLPIAMVLALAAQLSAAVWYASQQAATIANLEETVGQIGSRMAIEDNINLKRDVQDNEMELQYAFDEIDDLWDEIASMTMAIGEINKLKARLAAIESELKYIGRDHMNMTGGK